MLKKLGILMILLISACGVESDNETESTQDLTASTELGKQQPGDTRQEACKIAVDLGYGDLSVQSCLAGAPINAEGVLAELPADATPQSCIKYSGSCTGFSGCSRAVGGGWEWTVCGHFIYAWLTVCGSDLTGWGHSPCL